MIRRLVLELTTTEARALVVAASESRIAVEKSLTVPLAAGEEKDTLSASEQQFVDALAAAGLAKYEAIAVVGRADVELRLLTVPPAPDAELPSLVRFQATQELPNLDADTPLDYLPLDEAADQPRRVLAAVLKPGIRERIVRLCDAANLALTHIVLRSAASASLMLQEKPELRDRCFLLVEIIGRRVELAAVNRRRVVFLRHVLLPGDPSQSSEAAESLVSEVVRTRVVVANQESGQTVDPVILIGQGPSRRGLVEQLGSAVGVPAMLVDSLPRTAVVAGGAALSDQDRDSATALLGAVADVAAARAAAFDFLNPRQPPKPPSRRNTYVLAGVVAATALLALVVVNQVRTASLTRDVLRLQNESAALDARVKEADAVIAASEKIESWLDEGVLWLDELRWLSDQFPSAKDARLEKLTALGNDRRRQMDLVGLARDAGAKAELDENLRDKTHQVAPKNSDARTGDQYKITFSSTVHIKKQP